MTNNFIIRYLAMLLYGILLFNTASVLAAETYRFERLWPLLPERWYFNEPADIAVDPQAGIVYVADTDNNSVKALTLNGGLITQWRIDETNSRIVPRRLAIDAQGNVYVLCRDKDKFDENVKHLVQKFNPHGELIAGWTLHDYPGGDGGGDGLAIDSHNQVLYLVNGVQRLIQEFALSDGHFLQEWSINSLSKEDDLVDNKMRIALDQHDNLYLLETDNHRVRKYVFNNKTGQWKSGIVWGKLGSRPGEFRFPEGIAIDRNDNVYIVDRQNFRIQKFTAEGKFLIEWQDLQGIDIQQWQNLATNSWFNQLVELAKLANSEEELFILLTETLQAPPGLAKVVGKWLWYVSIMGITPSSSSDIKISLPNGIATDQQGNVYVAYNFPKSAVQKYNSEGQALERWASGGSGSGQLNTPVNLARDSQDAIYVVDMQNHRVVKFTDKGELDNEWGQTEAGQTLFIMPVGIAIDQEDNIYVSDSVAIRIYKFTPTGQLVTDWGYDFSSEEEADIIGTLLGDPEAMLPTGLATDSQNNVYIVDSWRKRIQKCTATEEGHYTCRWLVDSSEEDKKGIFDSSPFGIAIDGNDTLYVTEPYSYRVTQLTNEGQVKKQWGGYWSGQSGEPCETNDPQAVCNNNFDLLGFISTDSKNKVYVVDSENARVLKFDAQGQFITKWGEFGTSPSQLGQPVGIAVNSQGKVYVSDGSLNRIQVFNPALYNPGKAIIVAGGGANTANLLWDSTQTMANLAYNTLTYQGFTKNTIRYFSANPNLDLDSNGKLDDIYDIPTEQSLAAIFSSDWLAEADNLTFYLTDHGGNQEFVLDRQNSGDVTLSANVLKGWLDDWQAQHPRGTIKIIYDACKSGSFLPHFTPPTGQGRVVITSTNETQAALFSSQGAYSFSYYFWNRILYGNNLADAFIQTQEAVSTSQMPLLNTNGNEVANEIEDSTLAKEMFIGNGVFTLEDAPVIKSVDHPKQYLDEHTQSASIKAEISANEQCHPGGNTDKCVQRVWGVVRPPALLQNSNTGLSDISTWTEFELTATDQANVYQGRYDGFTEEGTYEVTVYAKNFLETKSKPYTVSVTVQTPWKRRAIIVAGVGTSRQANNISAAYAALKQQGYADDNIYLVGEIFLIGQSVQPVTPSVSVMQNTFDKIAESPTKDLVVYLEGQGDESGFQLNSEEKLSWSALVTQLDELQGVIKGVMTVIYEGPQSSYLWSALGKSKAEGPRIVITSVSEKVDVAIDQAEKLSFSEHFWPQVLNGTTVKTAFNHAEDKVIRDGGLQPQLTEQCDKKSSKTPAHSWPCAENYYLGTGLQFGGTGTPVNNHLIPSQMVYESGESLHVGLPTLPATEIAYLAMSMPDGRWFILTAWNRLEPFDFDNNLIPAWQGTSTEAINLPLDASFPPGEYRLYFVIQPAGEPLNLEKLNPSQIGISGFLVK